MPLRPYPEVRKVLIKVRSRHAKGCSALGMLHAGQERERERCHVTQHHTEIKSKMKWERALTSFSLTCIFISILTFLPIMINKILNHKSKMDRCSFKSTNLAEQLARIPGQSVHLLCRDLRTSFKYSIRFKSV